MATELDMGMKCIKYMLYTVNLMFVITAALIISVGTTIYAIYYDFDHFIKDGFYSPANLLISIGVIMLIISLFGCVGAIKESTAMINVFALLLSIVFVLDISASIASYSLQNGLVEMVNDKLHFAVKNYYHMEGEHVEAMDFVQSRLTCCGISSPDDWLPNKPPGNATESPDENNPSTVYPPINTTENTDYPNATDYTDFANATDYTNYPNATDYTDFTNATDYTTENYSESPATNTSDSSTEYMVNSTEPVKDDPEKRMMYYELPIPSQLIRGMNTNKTHKLPPSCCPTYYSNPDSECYLEDSYEKGCMNKLTYVISQSSFLLGTGALTIAFIQFVGIVFAIMLAKAIRQAKSDRERRKWEIREQMINSAYTQMEQMESRQAPKPDNPAPRIYVAHTGHS